MGLFDYVRCRHPLPDGFEPGDGLFQTKSMDCPYLNVYVITEDGRLIREDGGEDLSDFHGDLEFGWSNLTAGWNGFVATENDAEVDIRDYVARFSDGRLKRITGGREDTSEWNRLDRAELHRRSNKAWEARQLYGD